MNVLLAKRPAVAGQPTDAETLLGHTESVLEAADVLLEERGRESLAAAGLPDEWLGRLRRIVSIAAFGHDLGKCNDQFQALVGNGHRGQLVRHEALSAYLLWPDAVLGKWLVGPAGVRRDHLLAVLVIAGHHRRFPTRAVDPPAQGNGSSMTLRIASDEFGNILDVARERFQLPAPPRLKDIVVEHRWNARFDETAIDEWRADGDLKGFTDDDKRLLAVAKAMLICADVAGSALPRQGKKSQWIADAISDSRREGSVAGKVVHASLGGQRLRPFQDRVASSSGLVLVRAGCGTGKTVAAYEWAKRQCDGRPLWFAYPTTGTATEGFKGYQLPAEVDGQLVHSRARVDLELLDVPGASEAFDRLDALQVWRAPVVACTVDSVLGLVQAQRRGIYAWPSLCAGAVVFDEIHAYDDTLFGALLRFLSDLPGIPALLMTASLPRPREQALRQVAGQRGGHLTVVNGPAVIEGRPRYRAVRAADVMGEVKACWGRGGRVLWVSNTVDRCRTAAGRMEAALGGPVLVYHSRFKYVDRVKRHEALMDAFAGQGPVLAATTQVAEMSLDISADLLVTELAPIPALIQRLGRLNRGGNPGPPCPFVVLREPERARPYGEDELAAASEWLSRLKKDPLSQRDLIAAWRRPPAALAAQSPSVSALFDGVFETEPADVRDSESGLSVILEDDLAAVRGGRLDPAAAAIPMPVRRGWQEWKRLRGYVVAPRQAVEYDEMRGAKWR